MEDIVVVGGEEAIEPVFVELFEIKPDTALRKMFDMERLEVGGLKKQLVLPHPLKLLLAVAPLIFPHPGFDAVGAWRLSLVGRWQPAL